MGRTEIEAEITLLLERLEACPQEAYEIQLQVLANLNEMRAFGMRLPEHLAALETALEEELAVRASHRGDTGKPTKSDSAGEGCC